jgi:hypothetical protein
VYSDAVFLSNRHPKSPLTTICDIYGYMEEVSGARALQ